MRQYPGFRRSLLKARKSSTSTIAFTTALTIGINSGHAQTVIESSNQSQTLSTDTAYVVNVGTEVSDKKDDAIIVNGIAPVTVTNAGTLVGGQKVFVERKQVDTCQMDAAGARRVQARDNRQQGAFARARCPNDGHRLPRREGKIDIAQNGQRAGGIGDRLADATCDDHGRRVCRPALPRPLNLMLLKHA